MEKIEWGIFSSAFQIWAYDGPMSVVRALHFGFARYLTRRAGVSRRVIFRGQGEVGAKLKLNTNITFAPFNLDLLKISSYAFSWGYGRSRE